MQNKSNTESSLGYFHFALNDHKILIKVTLLKVFKWVVTKTGSIILIPTLRLLSGTLDISVIATQLCQAFLCTIV